MNPNTARFVLDNANTRTFLTSYGANPSIGDYDINKVLQSLIPGLPPVEIYKGWYQTESNASGQPTSTGGTSVRGPAHRLGRHLLHPGRPDFSECSLPGNDKIGESGPGCAPGQRLDRRAGLRQVPGRRRQHRARHEGRPGQPLSRPRGGRPTAALKLDRAFDLLTANVAPSLYTAPLVTPAPSYVV